jgi:hypothetical protein
MAADGTEYLIELATKFSGGDAAVTTLADLGDRMQSAGAMAEGLEGVVAGMARAFEESGAAIKLASDAVTQGEANYQAAEVAAERAAKMVERVGALAEAQRGKLRAALDAGDPAAVDRITAKLNDLAMRQDEVATRADDAAAAMRGEAAALDAVKASASAVVENHASLRMGLYDVKVAAEQAAKAERLAAIAVAEHQKNIKAAAIEAAKAEKIAAVAAAERQKVAEAASRASAEQAAKMAAAAAGTGKINEMSAAFSKLGGPAGAAGQKVLGFAEGFKKLGSSMGSAGPYVAMGLAIVAITTAAIVGTAAIAKWAVGLADAGRTTTLLSAGIARSVEGGAALDATIARLGNVVPQTADELRAMAGDLAKTGLRGKALTDELESAAVKAAELKFGPDFAKQMLSLDVQSKRFGANLAGTFGGLNIEGLLGGMSSLVALFDSSTASGQTMKFLFETLFQPIIDGVAEAIPKIERLFLYAEIWALKAYIGLKPYMGIIKTIGTAFLWVAGIVTGVIVVAFMAAFASIAMTIMAPILAIALFVAAIVGIVNVVRENFGKIVAFMKGIGGDIILGLVNGITGGIPAVVGAISDAIGGGIAAAKKLLLSGSPSMVFAGLGEGTAEGFVQGVEGGAGDAQGALAAMVAPPKTGVPGAAGAGGGVTLTIGELILGAGTAKEQADEFIGHVTDWLESEGLSIGSGGVPA